MTKEEKQILLKDLCARLPYGVVIQITSDGGMVEASYDMRLDAGLLGDLLHSEDNFMPYLRPMSSMTEEELNECVCQSGIKDIECPNWQDIPKEKQFEARLNHAIAVFLTDSNNVDWLNENHFDYRGLIPMGIALEAPKNMYNKE